MRVWGTCVWLSLGPGKRELYGDHERFVETYFSSYPGYYFTGDGCVRDAMGYYTITGRVDDVLNVSGHRIGTAEIEAVLNDLAGVAEVAVVGKPHEIKGQGVCAFVVPQSASNAPSADELNVALRTLLVPMLDWISYTLCLGYLRQGQESVCGEFFAS